MGRLAIVADLFFADVPTMTAAQTDLTNVMAGHGLTNPEGTAPATVNVQQFHEDIGLMTGLGIRAIGSTRATLLTAFNAIVARFQADGAIVPSTCKLLVVLDGGGLDNALSISQAAQPDGTWA